MPDRYAPQSFITNSLAAGEVSPGLYGRTDLAKFHQGCFTMKNFFVDYRGGASTRPGTQFIGNPASAGYARLWPFKFSATIGQTYMLVFSDSKLKFIKNPGGNTYPNGSNAGFILNAGVPYEITTPYVAADLPYLKFSQVADKLTITRRGYARRILARISDTNWTLTPVSSAPVFPNAPTITSITISPNPAGSTDPVNTDYLYVVTAVDADGNESPPGTPVIGGPGIDIGTTQGTVTVFYTPVANAVYYKIYKALPSPGAKVPSFAQELGFAGFSYGTSFLDSNIVPDFSKSPPVSGDPFTAGQVIGFTIAASSNDWPVGGTTITVTGGGGAGAIIYPILDNNTAGGVGHITGLYIVNPGFGYTSPPALAAVGAGGTVFAATAILGPLTGLDPDVVALFQQRQIYGATLNRPNTIFGSRPGHFTDFRTTNPSVDSDAFSFTIAAQQVNTLVWALAMPGGLVVGTDSGILQLTGGSASASAPLAVTPSSAVIVPQSYYGAADVHPIVIDYDILYVQLEGSIIRDLQYNFFVNIYTGTDITSLSSHLFYPLVITDWAYQDTPNKVIWAVRNDGTLLSLTFLKSQEILGWARHETNGLVESVGVVQEGATDAVYISVNRNGTRSIERLCDRIYYQIDDAWCLDAALSTVPTWPAANLVLNGTTGNIIATADAAVFAPGDVGKVLRSVSSKATITGFTSGSVALLTVDPEYPFGSTVLANGAWRLNQVVGGVGGLAHLNGQVVYALVDGNVQGPFTVAGGAVALTTPGSAVVVGLPYQCQLQPLFFDVGGEGTIQGDRKKITAATFRVKDAARLKYGRSFSTVREFVQGTTSTDPIEDLPYRGTRLALGDQRIVLNQDFNRVGSVAIQQDYPLPATILAVISEVARGDTR